MISEKQIHFPIDILSIKYVMERGNITRETHFQFQENNI